MVLLTGLLAIVIGGCTGELESDRRTGTSSADAACEGAADGAACDDGLYCTVSDRCHAGACIGDPRSCHDAVGFCEVARCDEAQDTCAAEPRDACVDRCDTPKLQAQYRKGWTIGHAKVSRAWGRAGQECSEAEAFVEDVTRRIEEAQQDKDPDADCEKDHGCRQAGVLDGSYAALEAIQVVCDQICFLDGDLVGSMAARAYCETAMAAGEPLEVSEWFRGPLNLCGLSYETACDGSFIGGSIDYVSAAGTCERFTRGAYETPWDRTRARACDYQNRSGLATPPASTR